MLSNFSGKAISRLARQFTIYNFQIIYKSQFKKTVSNFWHEKTGLCDPVLCVLVFGLRRLIDNRKPIVFLIESGDVDPKIKLIITGLDMENAWFTFSLP